MLEWFSASRNRGLATSTSAIKYVQALADNFLCSAVDSELSLASFPSSAQFLKTAQREQLESDAMRSLQLILEKRQNGIDITRSERRHALKLLRAINQNKP